MTSMHRFWPPVARIANGGSGNNNHGHMSSLPAVWPQGWPMFGLENGPCQGGLKCHWSQLIQFNGAEENARFKLKVESHKAKGWLATKCISLSEFALALWEKQVNYVVYGSHFGQRQLAERGVGKNVSQLEDSLLLPTQQGMQLFSLALARVAATCCWYQFH